MGFLGGTNLTKRKIVLSVCLSFVSGIALASFLPLNFGIWEIWWFGAAIFFLVLAILFWRYNRQSGLRPLSFLFLLAVFFLLAVWRYFLSLPADTPDKIWHYNGRTLLVKGYVADEPDVRESSQKLKIEVMNISSAATSGRGDGIEGKARVAGKILVTTALYPEYRYGDILSLVCQLERPEKIKDFSYDRYLARWDVYSVCYWPKTVYLNDGSGGGNWFYAKIFSCKKTLSGLIDSGMPEPEASLARPIVFGGQKGLEQKIRDDFQKTGLTHIMAVSGFNISILAAMVMAILLALGFNRGRAFYLASVFLLIYIIMVGLPASAARAGLMGFLVLWALKLGRLNKITNSLALTAVVLLIINPKLLRDDVGFQLSFGALIGLVYIYPLLEAIWGKIGLPKLKGLSDGLLITLAAQVFTWPILAYNFSQVSLIAPLANLAVLWTLPILTILILAALPLSWLLPGLSFLFFLPAYVLTEYILLVVNYLASWPYGYLETGYFWSGWILVYYLSAIFVTIKLRKKFLLD